VDALNSRRKALNGSRILVAGVSYKANIDDIRESPALDVMGLLHAGGADVSYMDPYVPSVAAHQWNGGRDLRAVPFSHSALAHADCVVILTNHAAFDYDAIAKAPLVVDTRNALANHDGVFRLGAPHPDVRTAAPVCAAS
jgi:UDP-N-acetyl-D-glucosamine dehydrogenase